MGGILPLSHTLRQVPPNSSDLYISPLTEAHLCFTVSRPARLSSLFCQSAAVAARGVEADKSRCGVRHAQLSSVGCSCWEAGLLQEVRPDEVSAAFIVGRHQMPPCGGATVGLCAQTLGHKDKNAVHNCTGIIASRLGGSDLFLSFLGQKLRREHKLRSRWSLYDVVRQHGDRSCRPALKVLTGREPATAGGRPLEGPKGCAARLYSIS